MNRKQRRAQSATSRGSAQQEESWVRMTDVSKVTLLVRECYAMHFILRNLDFSSDDLFVQAVQVPNWQPPGLCVVVKLIAQGREFVYVLAAVTVEVAKAFGEAWLEFVTRQPSMSKEHLDGLVYGSLLWKNKVELLFKLTEKGFVLPSEKKAGWDVN